MNTNVYRLPEALVEELGAAIRATLARLDLPATPLNTGEILRNVIEVIELYDGPGRSHPPLAQRS